MDQYLPLLKGKRIGMVVNHTSVVGRKQVHLLDTLLKRDVRVVKVFAPEHGFRGNADAGETVKDGKDSRTGIPIVSLYGDNKKPSAAQLKDVDLIVFDIQDVGARFYTYISTMYYVMEACAENKKEMVVLDRPNPCDYVDGPLQAVIFCVLILIIQQLDGNFIGPKILGSSIGISALWILFSIVVGGDLFGIVGMVVGVPVFATLYGLAQEFVHYALDKRGIDSEGNPVEHEAEDTENVFE